MIRNFLASIIAMASIFTAFGQLNIAVPTTSDSTTSTSSATEDVKPKLVISGAVDVYYKYDFNNPKTSPYNSFTSFTKSQNSFALGMANVKFEYQTKKLDMVADLGFGEREKEFAYNDNGISQGIKQLYISYSPTSWLKLTAGSWATHVNYELADAFANRNYSMSYLFTIGPFSHTGLRADITKGKSGFMVGISNATDYRTPPDGQIKKKFLIAQYSYIANDNVQLYLNYVGGQGPDTSKSNLFNLILTSKINDKFGIVYNGIINGTKQWNGSKNISAKTWWGSALYFNYDPISSFGLTLRAEYFNDNKQMNLFSSTIAGGNVFSTTLSANFKISDLTIIPEIRIDNATQSIFTKENGNNTKSAANLLLAAVYKF